MEKHYEKKTAQQVAEMNKLGSLENNSEHSPLSHSAVPIQYKSLRSSLEADSEENGSAIEQKENTKSVGFSNWIQPTGQPGLGAGRRLGFQAPPFQFQSKFDEKDNTESKELSLDGMRLGANADTITADSSSNINSIDSSQNLVGGSKSDGKGGNAIQKKSKDLSGMPEEVQEKMEKSFGTDFSDVQIHANSSDATEMGALAYTSGSSIHFAPGQDPYSDKGQEILGHELAHVVQQREGRVSATHQENGRDVNDSETLEKEADSLGLKAAAGEKTTPSSSKKEGVKTNSIQKKGVIQKYAAMPTGATIVSIAPNLDNIYLACASLARQVEPRTSGNVNWALRIGRQLEGSLTANTLTPVYVNFTEDSGINMDWNVAIQWRINNPRAVGAAQSGQVTRGTGGSTQVQDGSGTSTQDSAGATGSLGGHEGAPGGGVSVGTQSGTSTSQGHQSTINGGGSTQTTEQRQTFSAELVASITINGSNNFSGSDYINPFKWGTTIGGAITNNGPQSGSYSGGTVEYETRPPR